ncbi:MAG: MMPL family transporter [Candidatus Hadarchaeota archaeon]
MIGRMVRTVERRPYLVLLCVVLVSGFMAYGLTKVTMTTDFKTFLPESSPSVKTTLELENRFGSTSYELVLLQADDVTTSSAIRGILDLENILRSEPGLENYATMYSSYVDLVLQYIPNYQLLSDQQLEAAVRAVLDNLLSNSQTSGSVSRFLTADRKATIIFIYTNTQLTRSELLEKTDIMQSLVDNFERSHTDLTLGVSGTYSGYGEIAGLMSRDNGVLIPVAMVLVVTLLFLTFRKFSDILLCFLVIGLGSFWAIGTMGYLGLGFTMVHVALVPLLLGMGVDYSVYMLNRYYEERGGGLVARDAVGISIRRIGPAILVSTITTAIGFASFSISDIPPIQTMGILAALGIFFAFVLALTMLPAFVVLRDGRKVGKVKAIVVKRGKKVDRALSIAVTGAERHSLVVVSFVAVVVAASLIAALGVSTTMSFETFLPSDVESIATANKIENLFGGQSFIFVLAGGNVLSPSGLSDMLQLENAVLSNDNNSNPKIITGSLSIADLVVAAAGRPPSLLTEAEIAAVVSGLRASSTYQSQIRMLLTADNSRATMIFYTDAKTDVEMKQASDIVRNTVPAYSGNSLDLTTNGAPAVGGEPVIISDIFGSILSGMINTTVLALVLCFIVLVLIFRSLWMGALATLPVILVVAWELGTLKLLGWSLDVLTMAISALVIGAGIDYSIQIVHRFRWEWKSRGRSPEEAIRNTVMNTGTALLAAMGTTVGVFVILILSRMPAMSRFGGLTAAVVSYALIAALFMLPSFIMVYAARKRRGR